MPIAEHPSDNSWGYQCTGFYSPTSRYGTANDLKEIIRQTVFSISDNESNKIMTGELFEINGNEFLVLSLQIRG